jgi:phospholipid transport system substrate-binding protein
MRILLFIVFSLGLTVPTIAKSYEISPYATLEEVGNRLFSRIANNQHEIKKFPEIMRDIINEELMPSIDHRYAAFKILGKHLKQTSKDQRVQFTESVRDYLAQTYASVLVNYSNQQVIFETAKPTDGKKIVAIKSRIVEMNKPDINVTFKMRLNKKTGEWKVFDLIVEGISLLSSKKSEISKRISKHGVEQVSLELAYVN